MVDNEQFSKAFRIETARARDFQSIASVAFLVAKAPSQVMPTIASLEKWLNTEAAVDDNIKEDILESFTKFISLVLNPKLSEPVKRGRLSPAEFIMICYFMSLIRKSCTDEEISKAVGDLRDDVRRKHDDIRTNNKVFKTMFTFVNNFRNSLVGKTTTGQRAKRKRDSAEDVAPGRKPTPHVGTSQLARRTNPVSSSVSTSSQRKSTETRATLVPIPLGPKIPRITTSQTEVATPATTSTPNTSSRGSMVPQPTTLSQKSPTSGPPSASTAPNRPTHFDPLAVVEAAKLQAGQYSRSGEPYSLGFVSTSSILPMTISGILPSSANTRPGLNLTRNLSISGPVPPPPPPTRPPYQPPPPPHGHNPTQPPLPAHVQNPNQRSPHPGYIRQSQLPPPTPTRDPRRPQQGGGLR